MVFQRNTQESYVRAVRQLADHYHKSPEQINDEELRQYFLYLKNERKVSRSTSTIALCAIKFLYEYTLGRSWSKLAFMRPPYEKKLPVILSREEVQRFLGCIRNPRHQVCLSTIYACGLRRNEALGLQVGDIDGERMVVHVRKGKWSKDRYVPLPQPTLNQLRTWWATHGNPIWLFPTGGQAVRATATKPMSALGLYRVIAEVRKECKIEKAITIHTFRHALCHPFYTRMASICASFRSTWATHRSRRRLSISMRPACRKRERDCIDQRDAGGSGHGRPS